MELLLEDFLPLTLTYKIYPSHDKAIRMIFTPGEEYNNVEFKDNYYDVKYNDMNFAIIMGAEHAGVSKSLLKASDFVVKIPMQNSFNSLNVSNALSAIIFETLRQKLNNNK